MTICPNFPLSPGIWFQGVSGKFGQMVIFELPGIKFGIEKHVQKLDSLVSLWRRSLHNVLIVSGGLRCSLKARTRSKTQLSQISLYKCDFLIFTYSEIRKLELQKSNVGLLILAYSQV